MLGEVAEAGGLYRRAILVHQLAVEPAALARRKDIRGQVERIGVGREERRHLVANHHRGQGCVRVRLAHTHLGLLRWFLYGDARDQLRGARDATEVFLHPANCVCGRKIANDHQRSVIRAVVGLEKAAHFLDRSFVQIIHAADGGVVVRVHLEGHGIQVFDHQAVRAVLHAQAAFFLDHFALRLEIGLVHVEAAHPVGFEPDHAFEEVAGEGFPVHGDVVVGIRVVKPAHRFDDA